MTQKNKALPAILAAEKVLEIIVDLEPEEIRRALSVIGTAGATFGILWGLSNIRTSHYDMDFYEVKQKVLEFFQEIKADSRYNITVVAVQMHRAKKLQEAKD